MNTGLADADLSHTDVAYAQLDLLPDSLPNAVSIYTVENLQLVRFFKEPSGLVKLRSTLKDLGLRTQENQLTCAIRRSELHRHEYPNPNTPFVHSFFERTFNDVFFDWTCE